MKKTFSILKNGLGVGLIIQLAIGPIFFFVISLALQKTVFDGLMGVLAATIVSYIYIALSILGVGELLENKKVKKVFGIVSSIILVIFGVIIINGAISSGISETVVNTTDLFSSFTSVFLLAISNPLSIVFFTGLFSAKAIEYNLQKKELYLFGLGVGFSTIIFMGGSVLFFSLLKGTIPVIVIQILNITVGTLIIGYGLIRLVQLLKKTTHQPSKLRSEKDIN
ncbi:LysE family translocator [Candidatus Micrarchaeota archaeon]|jgi:threonine/homoserine/homoserine lactone efflux protein|nr:LysE family translocator [Candidatus Micrarchaeota archaeon]